MRAAKELQPDLIILNISMPEMNGFDAARMIRSIYPHAAIVILSAHKNEQFEAEARRIGVQGYVSKSDAARELVNAIENAEIEEGYTVAE